MWFGGFNWNGLAGQSLPAPWLPDRRKIQAWQRGMGLRMGVSPYGGGSFTMRNCQDGWEIPPDAGKPVCPEQGNESLMDDPTMEP